jgi:hypothetical protein
VNALHHVFVIMYFQTLANKAEALGDRKKARKWRACAVQSQKDFDTIHRLKRRAPLADAASDTEEGT